MKAKIIKYFWYLLQFWLLALTVELCIRRFYFEQVPTQISTWVVIVSLTANAIFFATGIWPMLSAAIPRMPPEDDDA